MSRAKGLIDLWNYDFTIGKLGKDTKKKSCKLVCLLWSMSKN